MHHPNTPSAPGAACLNASAIVSADADMTRLRVLIADKDPKTRFLLSRLLQGQGFAVVGDAEGRADTLALARELRPHLLLIGSTLSGAERLDVVRQAKKHFPDLGVTVLMDMQDFGAIGTLLEHGAGAVLATPVDSAMLFAELRRAGNRCIAKLATRCILNFRAPEWERYARALPTQCDHPAGPQRVPVDPVAEFA